MQQKATTASTSQSRALNPTPKILSALSIPVSKRSSPRWTGRSSRASAPCSEIGTLGRVSLCKIGAFLSRVRFWDILDLETLRSKSGMRLQKYIPVKSRIENQPAPPLFLCTCGRRPRTLYVPALKLTFSFSLGTSVLFRVCQSARLLFKLPCCYRKGSRQGQAAARQRGGHNLHSKPYCAPKNGLFCGGFEMLYETWNVQS